MWLGEHLKQNLMKILWDTYGVSNNHKQSPFFQIHLQDSGIIFFSVWMGLYLLAYTWKEDGKKPDGANKFLIKNNSEMNILHAKLLYKTQSCDIQHPQSATELHFQNLRKITTQE